MSLSIRNLNACWKSKEDSKYTSFVDLQNKTKYKNVEQNNLFLF
jgi:hypothetical protein